MVLLDILFPSCCFHCGTLGSYLCLSCEKKLKRAPDECIRCNKSSYLGFTHSQCKKKTPLDGVLSIFVYEPAIGSLIKGIKYHLVTDAQKTVFQVVSWEAIQSFYAYRSIKEAAFLLPMPLHKRRQRERGFNQSLFIAHRFSHLFGYPIISVLERKSTRPQAQIDVSKRKQNVKGIFSLLPGVDVAGKVIILVDDVVTTGATAEEAARILKKAGAHEVFVFSLARG